MAETTLTQSLVDRFPALNRLGGARCRIPFFQQLHMSECGLACLAMVLGYHGKTISREKLRDTLVSGRYGTTARGILDAARHHALRGRGVRMDRDALRYLPTGSILHWELNHFVVYQGLAKNGVDIVDPAAGRRRVGHVEFGKCFTGVAIILEPTREFQPDGRATQRGGDFHRVLWDSGEWGRILPLSFFLQALTLALPLLTGALIDRVIPRADTHMLAVLSVGLCAIVMFHLMASLVRSHLLLHMQTLADARLTLSFLERLMALPYSFFQRRSAGDILMRWNSNALIRETLGSGMLSGMLDGLLMLGYFALLFALSITTGLLVCSLCVVQIGVFLVTSRERRERNSMLIARQARCQSRQVEMVTGIETLKVMGVETRAQEEWSNLFVDVLNASLEQGRLAVTVEAVSLTLRMGAPLIVLALGTHQVVSDQLSLGTMLALNAFAIGVFTPLSNLVSTGAQLQQLSGYIERIGDVQTSQPERDPGAPSSTVRLTGRIELDRVSFRHGPLEPLAVREVSLCVDAGQLIAIVGQSGSGKSSLVSVLLGLYPPTSGRVLYDGCDLADADLVSLRRQLGVVTQRTRLFGMSIHANIALWDSTLPFERVTEAARIAQIHDDIMALPARYETVLTDGGDSLSEGQRQRLAIARALARQPRVLVLDEATSALDGITEHKLQDELERLQCTRIVIAHRLSTVMGADCIVVMHAGRVVECGCHAELLGRDGFYAQLVASQLTRGA